MLNKMSYLSSAKRTVDDNSTAIGMARSTDYSDLSDGDYVNSKLSRKRALELRRDAVQKWLQVSNSSPNFWKHKYYPYGVGVEPDQHVSRLNVMLKELNHLIKQEYEPRNDMIISIGRAIDVEQDALIPKKMVNCKTVETFDRLKMVCAQKWSLI